MALDPSDQDPVAVMPAPPATVQTPPYLAALPAPVHASPYEAPRKSRRAWIVPAAIAVVGLIAAGSLGYLLYSTNLKLQSTQAQLTESQLALDATSKDLKGEKARSVYIQMFENDMARESTDFATLGACDSYAACRTAADDMLSDSQTFQSDRESAKVPPEFANVDSMLGDDLTAEIAALKDLQSAFRSGDMTRAGDAFSAVNDASLSLFKAESALGKLIS